MGEELAADALRPCHAAAAINMVNKGRRIAINFQTGAEASDITLQTQVFGDCVAMYRKFMGKTEG